MTGVTLCASLPLVGCSSQDFTDHDEVAPGATSAALAADSRDPLAPDSAAQGTQVQVTRGDALEDLPVELRGSFPQGAKVRRRAQVKLPLTDQSYTVYKVAVPSTGLDSELAVDGKGKAVNHLAAQAKEEAARYAQRGAMSDSLYSEVSAGDPNALIPVLVKFKVPEKKFDKATFGAGGPNASELQAIKGEEKRVATEASSKLGGFLAAAKLSRGKASVDGPFAHLELPAAAIRSNAWSKDVAYIGLDRRDVVRDYPTIPQSLTQTGTQWAHNAGYRGAGTVVAVVESGLPDISTGCFHLAAQQTTSGSTDSHMTNSLGILGNRYGTGNCASATWEGYAPDASVVLANDSNYQTGFAWARGQGVNVVTMSWHFTDEETNGNPSSRDNYFDYWSVTYPYPTVFTSAGNQAPSAYSSGKGHNFMGVGDVSNGGVANRCDDTMESSSTYKDPISSHGDREVPAIASPGSRHDLLGRSFGGTSAATPVTAGIAAAVMSANSALKTWPEAMRAILLATANYQNADGTAHSSGVEGKDGAGETNTYFAYPTATTRETTTTAQFRAHDYGSMAPSDFVSGYFNKTWKVKFSPGGAHIRAALVWNSKVTSETSSVQDTDLDLQVFDSSGNMVTSSSSYDNSWELVDFVPTSGDYTIKIRGFNVPSDLSRYYAVAWTAYYDNGSCN